MGTVVVANSLESGGPRPGAHTSRLIEGPAGSGKTTLLLERFIALVSAGTDPGRIVLLSPTPGRARRHRAHLEPSLPDGFGELLVLAPHELAAALLRRAPGRGHLPEAVLSAPERLAMLSEHVDELVLAHHDFGGNASALLARVILRIDALKARQVSADRFSAWADGLDDDARLRAAARRGDRPAHGAREREFAALYAAHDRMLAEAGLLDRGDLLTLAVDAVSELGAAGSQVDHVLVDDAHELSGAAVALVHGLGADTLTVAGDPAAPAAATLTACAGPEADREILTARRRRPRRRFWTAATERAQAQRVAAEIWALIHDPDAPVAPGAIAVLVGSVARQGPAVAVALEQRAVPHRLVGAGGFFHRAEIRDLLAWLRVLSDPADAPAAVRALARPPVELRAVDIARVTQIARRRKLDMISALGAALESPQVSPEGRDRIRAFLGLYRACAAQIDTARPDVFVFRLIERLELRRRDLFAAQAEVVDRLRALARFGELAAAHALRSPRASARDFARSVAVVADQSVLAVAEDEEPDLDRPTEVQIVAQASGAGLDLEHVFVLGAAAPAGGGGEADEEVARLENALCRARTGAVLAVVGAQAGPGSPAGTLAAAGRAEWEAIEEELHSPEETLPALLRLLRGELLETTTRTAGRLGELRLDTDLDISHAVVRYLELLKVAALIARPDSQSLPDALANVNARIAQAVTAEQREILASTPLDDLLADAERDARGRGRARLLADREEPSLERFLPLRGDGVLLSASDIDLYRACPLKYKFARVFRIPQEPTLHQRFGIAVHQVLERFHNGARPVAGTGPGAEAGRGEPGTATDLLGLLDTAWRRQGFGDSDEERQLRRKAELALGRYQAAAAVDLAEPMWFERSFTFRLGPHYVRGRVDRVDRLPDGGYELVDYKTGRPRPAEALAEDVQLSLYTVAAREAWGLPASRGAYLYLLDDAKVAICADPEREAWIRAVAVEVAEGIRAQEFEATPSPAACGFCDYRLACPAAER